MNFLSRKLPVTFYLFTMKEKVSAGKINSAHVSHLLRLLRHYAKSVRMGKQDRTIKHEFLKLFFPDQQLNFSQTCFILDLDEKISLRRSASEIICILSVKY